MTDILQNPIRLQQLTKNKYTNQIKPPTIPKINKLFNIDTKALSKWSFERKKHKTIKLFPP